MDLSKPERLYQIARKIVAVPCAVEAVPAITPAPSAFVANLSNVLPPYASARGIGIAQQAGALLYEALKLGAFPKRRKLRNLITAHISAERATGDPHWVWNVQVLVWLEAVRGRYALLRDSERESQEPWVSDCRHIAALLLAEAKRLADTPAPGNEIGGAGTPVENQPQVKPVAGEGTEEQDERAPFGFPLPLARHSVDFVSVHWFGIDYDFTATQAACVKALWTAWENKTPVMQEQSILTEAESSGSRLRDVFEKGKHPAWGTMIAKAGKGRFRLQEPEKSQPPEKPQENPA